MRRIAKGIIVTSVIVALLVGVYIAGLQQGTRYKRYAKLNLDVGTYSFHVTVYVQRVGEDEPSFWSHHAGQITTIGKNYIEDQLGDTPNASAPAKWISLSSDAGTPALGWTQIPAEITTGGLARAEGTYASTGDGQWTIEKQFTATASHTNVQLTGLQWDSGGNNNLLAADTFSAVDLETDDKLTVTWTVTVS